jgi:glucokinase
MSGQERRADNASAYEGDKKMKHYLGLDVGGTKMVAGIVDENFNIIARESMPSNAGRSIDEITSDMARVSKMAAQKAGIRIEEFSSWGIGMPSYVNPKTKLLVHANNFGWKNVPILDYLKKYIPSLPIYLENDANCAAYGEVLAGTANECSNAIMLTLGTGVGGGVILNRKIFSGCDMMGAELGHTKLVYNGIRCTCGQKGCLESYCSVTALIRQAGDRMEKNRDTLMWDICNGDLAQLNGAVIFDAVRRGDKLAKEVADQYIDYLSAGISTFITIFRPEVVIVGGGLSHAGDDLIEPLNKRIRVNTFASEEIGVPNVVRAKLGNDAGIIGAAFLENSVK